MFRRVSLVGSAELFKETARPPELPEPDPPKEPAPEPARVHPRRRSSQAVALYQYTLTEAQVRALIEAVQKVKYPHNLKAAGKLSIDEFERLEALRQVLLDGLK